MVFLRRRPEQAWQSTMVVFLAFANYKKEVVETLLSKPTLTWAVANKDLEKITSKLRHFKEMPRIEPGAIGSVSAIITSVLCPL